jgi:hypothetical protein
MNEFYVGYLPKVPAGIARLMRITIVFLLVVTAAGAILFARVQRTFAPSAFEFGMPRNLEGIIETRPYPSLLVARPGASGNSQSFSRYLLVTEGKHGADSQVADLDGRKVKLRGTLIYRDGWTMVEVVSGSLSPVSDAVAAPQTATELETLELTGEIVDDKCYFGVMNPGSGKVHRDCAALCLSGGIPPSFVTNDLHGAPASLVLTDSSGHALAKDAFFKVIGQPVRVRGKVMRSGDAYYLETSGEEIVSIP